MMKYLKTFEQIQSVSSPLSRIKFLVDEFKTVMNLLIRINLLDN